MLKGKTVVLGVTGSIAAYKIASLASALVKLHADVHVIMTQNATNFINPITFETLTSNKCLVDTFDRNFQYNVEHVSLAKKADVFLVAPASANVIGKMANGIADDMLTTTILACKCPKLVSPAMNTNMYENQIVQDNLQKLENYGFKIIDPASGYLACGDTGAGKMPEPEVLFEYILKELPEIKEIFIEDDTFTVNQPRVIEFCDEIINRGLKPVWSCNTRVDLTFETMKKMKDAGCRLLVCGYESGNQEVLNEIKKGITLEQSKAFAENARKLDIKVFGCFMIGLTGDSLETIDETYKFAQSVYPDMCFFQQAVPFPGTGFYDWAKENGYLITEDYSKWLNDDGYLNCLVDYPYADHTEIEKLRDNLMSKYYFSFAYIVKTFLANLDWAEFRRVMRGGTQYIAFRVKKALKRADNLD